MKAELHDVVEWNAELWFVNRVERGFLTISKNHDDFDVCHEIRLDDVDAVYVLKDEAISVVIPDAVWKKIETTSIECKRIWGMGFPVISITILKNLLEGKKPFAR